jgi:hypothetical protein
MRMWQGVYPKAMLSFLLCSCGANHDDSAADTGELGAMESPLTGHTVATYWDPEVPIDVCFLSDGADLPTHEDWIRADVYRSWEYFTPVTFNWIDPCPATGSLIRIGLKYRTSEIAEWAGAQGYTAGAKKDERATATANVGTQPAYLRPSIIYYLREDLQLTDRVRVGHLTLHEFGHILGFAHEQDHPDSTCTAGQTTPQNAITEYDEDSVMSAGGYCHGDQDYLSHLDVVGAQLIYGVGPRYATTVRWFSAASLLM